MTAAVALGDVLDEVDTVLGRYVAFPSPEARHAVALWAAHTHAVEWAESTPRLALLSPEKGSGKTRTLEVLERLARAPRHTTNASAAALYRLTSRQPPPTLLVDEADAIFGAKAGPHEDLRALLNAGHRRGATTLRVNAERKPPEVEEFPAYAAAALAGIGDLPDTILDRAVVVRLRRRGPHEQVTPFRQRDGRGLEPLRDRLAAAVLAERDRLDGAEPDLPDGVADRAADVWEPLVALADAAGGHWPAQARTACLSLLASGQRPDGGSLRLRLLADTRALLGTDDRYLVPSAELVDGLLGLEEAPWVDLRGKPLDVRKLARFLAAYDVRPAAERPRPAEPPARGYRLADLRDLWARYLPPPPGALPPKETVTAVTSVTSPGATGSPVTAVTDTATLVTDAAAPVPPVIAGPVTAVTAVTDTPGGALRLVGDDGLDYVERKEEGGTREGVGACPTPATPARPSDDVDAAIFELHQARLIDLSQPENRWAAVGYDR